MSKIGGSLKHVYTRQNLKARGRLKWPAKSRGGIRDHVTPGRTGGKGSVLCLPQNPIGGSPPIVVFVAHPTLVALCNLVTSR